MFTLLKESLQSKATNEDDPEEGTKDLVETLLKKLVRPYYFIVLLLKGREGGCLGDVRSTEGVASALVVREGVVDGDARGSGKGSGMCVK